MKIMIVVNSLQSGGAERDSLRLGKDLALDGNQVILATLSSVRDFYDVPKEIHRVELDSLIESNPFRAISLIGKFGANKLIKAISIRRAYFKHKPDVVLAIETKIGILTYLSLFATKCGIVIRECIDPNPTNRKTRKSRSRIVPLILRFGKCLYTVQTHGFKDWAEANWRVSTLVIPNHMPDDWILNIREESNSQSVVSIGRMVHQKGFDNLLLAWNSLGTMTTGWTLKIFGSQKDEDYFSFLETLKSKNVELNSPIHDVKSELDNAYIFVSSSRYEGLPNVVLEAMARGLPVIAAYSTDALKDFASTGVVLGYHPEDTDALAKHLRLLISDPLKARELSDHSLTSIKEYTWEKLGTSWYEAFNLSIKIRTKNILARR
jgi:GalNAc-alpha-(1->4)-GalNAc-alpha-(1->3)-diNAcBac-PP-undecaprenol alpha-1,4-N-acetyl-D-galactosaminyltransferase